MIDKSELLNFQQEIKESSNTVFSWDLKLFLQFLNDWGFKQVIRLYPDTDEPTVTFLFPSNGGRPKIRFSDIATFEGDWFVPFSHRFVENMSTLIQELSCTDNDVGVSSSSEQDEHSKCWSYQFWLEDFSPETKQS